MNHRLWQILLLLCPFLVAANTTPEFFDQSIRPLLKEYCLNCHSTKDQKGDLDLERFTSVSEVKKHTRIWQGVIEQISVGEMPPANKPQPTTAQRQQFLAWITNVLHEVALARSGDPGPVVLRRLSNAEYTYTIRDITGVTTLDPAKEFPADGAAGEGFMNVGNALVMSPSLVTKYLDAGKSIASHAMLLPDGFRFSEHTTRRDWTEELLGEIRSLYRQYTDNGGGTSVNLQGIRFDTKDGGVIPLDKYLEYLLLERSGKSPANSNQLSVTYLKLLRDTLNDTASNLLLDPIRARWRDASPEQAAELAKQVSAWQHALWKFNSVGHIGKKNGPKAWMEPIAPLQNKQDLRLKIDPAKAETVLYLNVTDAGDGNAGDYVSIERPRFTKAGQADLLLKDAGAVAAELTSRRDTVLNQTAKYLNAASAQSTPPGLDTDALTAWLNYLGLNQTVPTKIEGHFKDRINHSSGYDFVKGWGKHETPLLVANSSPNHVRIPGNMKPNSVAVHPSPKLAATVIWRSPVAGQIDAQPIIQHAHPECGNGVAWSLELRRGTTVQRLANGNAQGGNPVKPAPIKNLIINNGDVVALVIDARDANHSCDLTAIDLTISSAGKVWDLAKDISPDVLAGNPHADTFGNADVWHFISEPTRAGTYNPVIPANSILSRWLAETNTETKASLAKEVEALLAGKTTRTKDSPDDKLYYQATSLGGPLFANLRQEITRKIPPSKQQSVVTINGKPAAFTESGNLAFQAPAIVEIILPTGLIADYEFVCSAALDQNKGSEGSVQFQVATTKPADASGMLAIQARTTDGEGPWYSNNRRVEHNAPIIVADNSQARARIEKHFDQFRNIFPAALCYTKIVPVDEVVTLTLFYREDHHFRRLMLDTAQSARLDRLWNQLHYVAQDALTLVDVFEQLWQYATQDADPNVFEPMREPIKQRAAEFRQLLVDTEPRHVEAALNFAELAYRRPLKESETAELQNLYKQLRREEIKHEDAIRLVISRILVSPAFLYKLEKAAPGEKQGPVDNYELASRLSYFLWSTAPDSELRNLAAAGKLAEPSVLVEQTRRMLRDPKTRRLATEFGAAWLHIYDFDQIGEKSERHYPHFNGLKSHMYEETILFITDLFQSDRSVLNLIDSDYTFVNEPLAAFYGFRNIKGNEFRKVTNARHWGRGGILGFASVLAKQSGASRTSPILRGTFISEVLLGEKLPKPPKDVPDLPDASSTEHLTMREITEKHVSDPRCAGCHARIDPYGFALENFDAIGAFRMYDFGDREINYKSKAPDGTELDGAAGLRQYLLTHRKDDFLRGFTRKLLGYALGREVLLSDTEILAQMQAALKANNYRVGAAVEIIVRSPQFREIRGKDNVEIVSN